MDFQQHAIHIRLLGQFAVLIDNESASLPQSIKTRALLLYLVLTGKAVNRELLCNLLWENTDDPRAGLRWALTKLRPILRDILITDQVSISVDPVCYGTDVAVLEEALHQNANIQVLQDLEQLISSDYLSGFDNEKCSVYQLWLEAERTTLRQLHKEVIRKIIAQIEGHTAEKLSYARKLFAIDAYDFKSAEQLLRTQIQHEGLKPTQKNLDLIRENWQKSGIDDSQLLLTWREITAPQIHDNKFAIWLDWDSSPNIEVFNPAALALPVKPSVAVIGFQGIVGEYAAVLAQGLTVDLTSRLSRLGGLFVIAHASSMRFSHQDLTPREIGQHLGVAYLICGTTQSSEHKLRVTVNLIEASTENTLWSENYTLEKEDIFNLQDDIVGAIVSRIEPEIEYAEYKRARGKDPENLNAWESYHLALWHMFRFTSSNTEIAHNYLTNAISLDDNFCRAHAALSFVHFSRAFLNCHSAPKKEIQLAKLSAQRSIQLNSKDAMGHWSLGRALFLDKEHDSALQSIQTSLIANPNYAQGHYAYGFIGAHSGVASETMAGLDTAIRLSPFDPLLFAMKSSRAISLVSQDKYAEAAYWGSLATREPNAHYHIYAIAAACFELSGDHEKAQDYIAQAKQKHPNYNQKIFFQSFPYKLQHEREKFSAALSKAGLKRA